MGASPKEEIYERELNVIFLIKNIYQFDDRRGGFHRCIEADAPRKKRG